MTEQSALYLAQMKAEALADSKAGDTPVDTLHNQLEVARTALTEAAARFVAIEAEGGVVGGLAPRKDFAYRIGVMAGLAQRGAELATAALAGSRPRPGDTMSDYDDSAADERWPGWANTLAGVELKAEVDRLHAALTDITEDESGVYANVKQTARFALGIEQPVDP